MKNSSYWGMPTCSNIPTETIRSNVPATVRLRSAAPGRAFARRAQLLFGQRDADDFGSAMSSKIHCEAAPSGADVENALAWSQKQLGRDVALLCLLRFLE